MSLVVLAIHGVGMHRPGVAADGIARTLEASGMTIPVHEVTWSGVVDHTRSGLRDLPRFLELIAVDIASAGALDSPLPPSAGRLASRIVLVERRLHTLSRALSSLFLALLFVAPIATVLVLFARGLSGRMGVEEFSWISRALIPIAVMVAITISVQLLAGLLRSVLERTTEALFAAIRRVLLLIFIPFFLLLSVPFALDWRRGVLFTYVVFLAPMGIVLLGLSLLVLAQGAFQENPDDLHLLVRIGASALLFPPAFYWLLGTLTGPWFDGPVKVSLDIFRYLADPDNRQKVHQELDRQLETIPGDEPGRRDLVLVAHSLGSIIALDSLLHSQAWNGWDRVQLITLGSPLKRFLIRFFPRIILPDSVGSIAERIRRRIADFHWLNVYRPFDYIGAGLALDRSEAGEDRSTRQWWKLFTSHSGYWSDSRVLAVIREPWADRPPKGTRSRPRGRLAYQPHPVVATPPTLRWLWTATRRHAWLAAISAAALMLISVVATGITPHPAVMERTAVPNFAYAETLASVTYHRTVASFMDIDIYTHHFDFSFTAAGEPVNHSVEIESLGGIPSEPLPFQFRKLARFVRRDCRPQRSKEWLFEMAVSIPCRRDGIELLYHPSEPTRFLLPSFPPPAIQWGAFGWISAISLFFQFALFLFLAFEAALYLFRLLLGVPRDPDELANM